ncbi:MAG: MarR family transcriptional regulator [Frankiales bacterium]|nr:MarR family transcriptional regulator [Frankiales bacterium]
MTEPAKRRHVRAVPPNAGSRQLATIHASADDSPGLLLWQVTNEWQAAQRAALKPYELTHVQFVLLASLTWLSSLPALANDGPVTQQQLAQHAATDPMMTSQVVRALAERGLIERTQHPTDARARALSVTARGRELANRAIVAVEHCDATFFAPLGKDAQHFAQQLRALRRR